MSLIGSITNVPLFSTIEEALAWGRLNGLSGYHVHNYQGQTGYMGGANHARASKTTTTRNSSSSSSSGSTGGY